MFLGIFIKNRNINLDQARAKVFLFYFFFRLNFHFIYVTCDLWFLLHFMIILVFIWLNINISVYITQSLYLKNMGIIFTWRGTPTLFLWIPRRYGELRRQIPLLALSNGLSPSRIPRHRPSSSRFVSAISGSFSDTGLGPSPLTVERKQRKM